MNNDVDGTTRPPAARAKWLRSRLSEPEATLMAIRNGEVDAFVVIEKEGERVYTLQDPEPPFRLMVEEMQEGAATLSPDAIVLYANRRLGELVGVPSAVLRGASLRDFVVLEDRERFDALLAGNGGRADLTLRRCDDALVGTSFAVNAFANEKVAAFCAIITDLTEQKRHAALKASEEAWKAADRRKDEFLAILAHELRNPLAAIGNAAQIVNRVASPDSAVSWSAGVIERQVGHVARIVDDLLDVSRIATGKLELRREPVDFVELVGRIAEVERPRFERRKRTLIVRVPDRPLVVHGDPTRLEQVVSNLMENARKFTGEKGKVVIRVSERDGWAELSVKDDGIGISPEMLDQVFELYAQGDRSLVQDQAGLGLGLNLVRGLAERHGGTVRAQSDGRGKGSEFIVSLPLTGTVKGKLDHAPAEVRSSVPRRVLVVEDHLDAAEGLALLLRMEGHEVRTSYESAAALEACESFSPDIVLLDIGLPGMDGYELGRRLREKLGDAVVLIALTGFGQDEDRRRSREAGIDEHVLKPLRPESIEKLLNLKRKTSD